MMKFIFLTALFLSNVLYAQQYVEKQQVTDFSNIVNNPGFENGLQNYRISTTSFASATTSTVSPLSGKRSLVLTMSTGLAAVSQTVQVPATLKAKQCEFIFTSTANAAFNYEVTNASGAAVVSNTTITQGTSIEQRPPTFTCGDQPLTFTIRGFLVSGTMQVDDIRIGKSKDKIDSVCLTDSACENYFGVNISSAGVVSNESTDWINGNCTTPSTGNKTCTFNTSLFSVAPQCYCNTLNSNRDCTVQVISTTTMQIETFITGGPPTYFNDNFTVVCLKAGADFKKTKDFLKSIMR